MTQEEKARRYDEALERARKCLDEKRDTCFVRPDVIFPELAESMDERIRKSLINLFKIENFNGYTTLNGIDVDDVITWLEKQGVQKPNPYTGTSFEYNGHIWGMCARDNGVEILFDGELKAFLSSDKSFIYPIHPQPSLIPKVERETVNEINLEPKFKVGDWVVCGVTGSVYQIKNCIENLNNHRYGYDLTNGGYIGSDEANLYHLWTIQDAKDGDVLLSKHNQPFIYNGIFDEDSVGAYCGIDCLGDDFLKDTFSCNWSYKEGVKPATKEQRDFLFQKMKEAGYEWDANKKELKKFHVIDEGKAEMDYCFTKMMNGEKVSSAWSEEDEKI